MRISDWSSDVCSSDLTFDGEPLYAADPPDEGEIAGRRERWFAPYHTAIRTHIDRLRAAHDRVVIYDAHSIRSRIDRESVVQGKSVSVRVDLGGRRISKTKTNKNN